MLEYNHATCNSPQQLPRLAQSVERVNLNSRVVGLSPILVSFYRFVDLADVLFRENDAFRLQLDFFIIVFACISEFLSSGKGFGLSV